MKAFLEYVCEISNEDKNILDFYISNLCLEKCIDILVYNTHIYTLLENDSYIIANPNSLKLLGEMRSIFTNTIFESKLYKWRFL